MPRTGPPSSTGSRRSSSSIKAPRESALIRGPLGSLGPGLGRDPFIPVNYLFDKLEQPANIIGNLAEGDISGAFRSGIGTNPVVPRPIRQRDEDKIFLSTVLRDRGILDDSALGIGLGLAADIFTDPTTYLTFGYGAGAKGVAATRRAARELDLLTKQASADGRRLLPSERALSTARLQRELEELPKNLSLGIGIPFSRSRTLSTEVGQLRSAKRTRVNQGNDKTLADLTEGLIGPSGGADEALRHIHNDTRRYIDALRAEIAGKAGRLDKAIRKSEKQLGLAKGSGASRISFHLENPQRYPLPAELAAHAEESRALLDEIHATEELAGIAKGEVQNIGYVPHMLAASSDLKALDDAPDILPSANALDNPFFVQHRTAENLEEFAAAAAERGLKIETNIANLIVRRANASLTAQLKKGIDDAVAETWGVARAEDAVKAADRSPSEVGQAKVVLDRLISAQPLGEVRAALTKAREKVVLARGAERQAARNGNQDALEKASIRRAHAEQEARAIIDGVLRDNPEALANLRQSARATDLADLAIMRQVAPEAAERMAASGVSLPGRMDELYEGVSGGVRAALDLYFAPRPIPAGGIFSNGDLIGRAPQVTAEEFEEFRSVFRKMKGAQTYHDGTLIPADISRDLQRVYKEISPNVTDQTKWRKSLAFVDQVTSRWKALALLSPGFHIRNMIDDGLRAYWAGARNPVSFNQAARALRHSSRSAKGKSAGSGRIKIKGRVYSYAEMIDLAEVHGVIRTGFIPAEVGSATTGISGDVSRGVRRGRGPGRGPITQFSGDVGQFREDFTRLGTFIELLKRGDDPITASRNVRNYLFDYGEVGQAVAAMRRFLVPFITFQVKAIENTARVAATRPGRLANIDKAIQATNELAGAEGEGGFANIPDHLQTGVFIPPALAALIDAEVPGTGVSTLGVEEGETPLLDLSRVTGFNSLNALDPRPEQIAQNASNLVTPLATVPAELSFGIGNDDSEGYSFYFQRPYPKRGVRAPLLIQQLARIPGVAPAIGFQKDGKTDLYTGEVVDSYSARINAILRAFPPFSQAAGVTESSESGTLTRFRYALGLPITTTDRARNQFYAEAFGD